MGYPIVKKSPHDKIPLYISEHLCYYPHVISFFPLGKVSWYVFPLSVNGEGE